MGGVQAYHWAALFPDRVERLAVVCGAAKISPHNFVFLEGVKAVLTADAGDTEKISEIIHECERMGIEVLPPDINESFYEFAVVPNKNQIKEFEQKRNKKEFEQIKE